MTSFFNLITGAAFAFSMAVGASAAAASDYKVAATLASGTFANASGHDTSGKVEVVKTEDGRTLLVLGADFMHDGAPDPQISLGNGKHVAATLMGKLKALKGHQVYEVPAGIDIADYTEAYVFCVRYNVPLGVAKF